MTVFLRKAMADWYARWYGVDLDPTTEVQPLIGSKEGILHVSLAFLNPGDGVLVPNPGYPTYGYVFGSFGLKKTERLVVKDEAIRIVVCYDYIVLLAECYYLFKKFEGGRSACRHVRIVDPHEFYFVERQFLECVEVWQPSFFLTPLPKRPGNPAITVTNHM